MPFCSPRKPNGHPRYTLEKINPLPEFDHVRAYGLNNLGHVVGDSYTLLAAHGLGVGRAFFWVSGHPPEELRAFGEKSSALAINDLGDVVGWVEEAQRTGLGEDDEEHVLVPVMWVGDRQRIPQWFPLRLPSSPGDSAEVINNRREVIGTRGAHWSVSGKTMKHRKLPLPPMPKSHRFKPTGINTDGTIVGYSYRSVQSPVSIEIEQQAWLCLRGRWKKLSPDAKTSAALGINDRKEIVGWVAPTGTAHFPMLWREAKPYPLGEQEGAAKAINAHGVIVGYTKRESRWWASLWQDGQPILLESRLPTGTKFPLYDAIAINDKGQILVSGAYLLTPTG
ncbi:hypothetical protein [Armatimonas sp.]|uniref:hypothetical protein n=1 Tax=Armatimonas sp. TaxID=1872638 RepID=UPI00286A85C3|nr:hypothetical protein [Armatimonas sp.]